MFAFLSFVLCVICAAILAYHSITVWPAFLFLAVLVLFVVLAANGQY